MLIVCPSCGIKYNVPTSYLTKDRTLKCASCGTSWLVPALRDEAKTSPESASAESVPAGPSAVPVASENSAAPAPEKEAAPPVEEAAESPVSSPDDGKASDSKDEVAEPVFGVSSHQDGPQEEKTEPSLPPILRTVAPKPAPAPEPEEEEDDRPFSFLDQAIARHAAQSDAVEEEHSVSSHHAPAQTVASGHSPMWEETALDTHALHSDENGTHGAFQDTLAAETERLGHLEEVEHHAVLGAEDEHSSHVEAAAPFERDSHQPDEIDDVVARLRSARGQGAGAAEAEKPTSVQAEPTPAMAESASWVPAWDRVERAEADEEMASVAKPEDEHAPIWDVGEDHGEQVAVQPASADEQAEPVRHVEPAVDMAERLRKDVLQRTATTEATKSERGSFLESQAFWKKAWIASGATAVLAVAAAVHWFDALSHVWPALRLL
ncbi:MJ0042-type zinc finger domain-containing protein [Acetobacter estunensis]|uniref:MJ0042-type zinc finger domain-containing protein n=1 Tax=Acetobacter estunensis TaxID=104097 RepID=UPI001C2DA92A|nr:zinc-ribbon domain-containing protein [Acetobacter estunensis]MBV1838308.1 zinc-ribbon domain-containing protein [Acetobacter estunensis]